MWKAALAAPLMLMVSFEQVGTAQLPTPQETAERLDAILTGYDENDLFHGAVLIGQGKAIIYKKGFGLANRDWGIENSTTTKFSIASLGKALTAHLVLQLVDQGLVSLEEPIGTYLPDLRKELAETVTVHHLLTHSSGLSWWADEGSPYYQTPYTLSELVEFAEDLDLSFEPGTKTLYSNSGYNLLAALIEGVLKTKFETALRERIFLPAGMMDTGFAWVDEVVESRATGYDRLPGPEYVPGLYNQQSYAIGAGGLYSTVEDMFRWSTFLDRDLSRGSWEEMFRSHVSGNGYGWGMGRYGKKSGGTGSYALGLGGTFGFASVQSRCLDDSFYMIILSNVRQLDQSRIANDIINTVLGYDATPPEQPTDDSFLLGLIENDVDEALTSFRTSVDEGEDVPGEGTIRSIGYDYLRHQRFSEATALLRFNVAAHPRSWAAHVSLADAYERQGLRKLAVESLVESLRLNPDNEAARKKIEQLRDGK